MKRLLACFLLCCTGALAAAPSQPLPPPSPPQIEARGYILVDADSGQVLASRNANERMEPASLTKLMTAYLAFTALKQGRLTLDATLTVSEKAWRTEGSRTFLPANEPARVDDLLHGLIIQSGNDAAVTLAEGIAGSEDAFAALMNREAQRLGMKNTHFVNATGLPHPQHYSTPFDLSLLARAIIRDFPEFYRLYALKEFTYNRITQPNRNQLLWRDPSVDGMKTGHTESAGFCLVASAKRQHMRLISVLMGADSENLRAAESQKLLNYGFQFFETLRPYARGALPGVEFAVWKGSARKVRGGLADDLYVTVPRGQYPFVSAQLISRQPLVAPVGQGQAVGALRVFLNGQLLVEKPVVAMESVPVGNFFTRAWDSLRLLFK